MRPLPSPSAGLPRCSNHHAYVPCPLPRRIGTGAFVDCFPVPRGLPQTLGGSASALSFSRPAQASLALRPARLLNRPRRPLSRGFDGAGCPATPPVSYQLNRQLAGWNPPPQVIRASEAHQRLRTSGEQRPCSNSLAISTQQYVKKRTCHSFHSLDTITSPVAKLIRTLVPAGRASLATTNGAASSATTISPCNSNVLLFRGTPRTKIV